MLASALWTFLIFAAPPAPETPEAAFRKATAALAALDYKAAEQMALHVLTLEPLNPAAALDHLHPITLLTHPCARSRAGDFAA